MAKSPKASKKAKKAKKATPPPKPSGLVIGDELADSEDIDSVFITDGLAQGEAVTVTCKRNGDARRVDSQRIQKWFDRHGISYVKGSYTQTGEMASCKGIYLG